MSIQNREKRIKRHLRKVIMEKDTAVVESDLKELSKEELLKKMEELRSSSGMAVTSTKPAIDLSKLASSDDDEDEDEVEKEERRQPDRPSQRKRKYMSLDDETRLRKAQKEFNRRLEDLIEDIEKEFDCKMKPWVQVIDETKGTFQTCFHTELRNPKGR